MDAVEKLLALEEIKQLRAKYWRTLDTKQWEDWGSVFTEDLVETWIAWKREKELDPIRLRPHPHEFYLYYDN